MWCEENTPHVSPLCRQNGNVFVPIASLAKGNARMTHTRAFASSLSDFRNSPSCGQFSVRVCVVCLLFHKKSLSILSLLVSSTISISTQPKKKGKKTVTHHNVNYFARVMHQRSTGRPSSTPSATLRSGTMTAAQLDTRGCFVRFVSSAYVRQFVFTLLPMAVLVFLLLYFAGLTTDEVQATNRRVVVTGAKSIAISVRGLLDATQQLVAGTTMLIHGGVLRDPTDLQRALSRSVLPLMASQKSVLSVHIDHGVNGSHGFLRATKLGDGSGWVEMAAMPLPKRLQLPFQRSYLSPSTSDSLTLVPRAAPLDDVALKQSAFGESNGWATSLFTMSSVFQRQPTVTQYNDTIIRFATPPRLTDAEAAQFGSLADPNGRDALYRAKTTGFVEISVPFRHRPSVRAFGRITFADTKFSSIFDGFTDVLAFVHMSATLKTITPSPTFFNSDEGSIVFAGQAWQQALFPGASLSYALKYAAFKGYGTPLTAAILTVTSLTTFGTLQPVLATQTRTWSVTYFPGMNSSTASYSNATTRAVLESRTVDVARDVLRAGESLATLFATGTLVDLMSLRSTEIEINSFLVSNAFLSSVDLTTSDKEVVLRFNKDAVSGAITADNAGPSLDDFATRFVTGGMATAFLSFAPVERDAVGVAAVRYYFRSGGTGDDGDAVAWNASVPQDRCPYMSSWAVPRASLNAGYFDQAQAPTSSSRFLFEGPFTYLAHSPMSSLNDQCVIATSLVFAVLSCVSWPTYVKAATASPVPESSCVTAIVSMSDIKAALLALDLKENATAAIAYRRTGRVVMATTNTGVRYSFHKDTSLTMLQLLNLTSLQWQWLANLDGSGYYGDDPTTLFASERVMSTTTTLFNTTINASSSTTSVNGGVGVVSALGEDELVIFLKIPKVDVGISLIVQRQTTNLDGLVFFCIFLFLFHCVFVLVNLQSLNHVSIATQQAAELLPSSDPGGVVHRPLPPSSFAEGAGEATSNHNGVVTLERPPKSVRLMAAINSDISSMLQSALDMSVMMQARKSHVQDGLTKENVEKSSLERHDVMLVGVCFRQIRDLTTDIFTALWSAVQGIQPLGSNLAGQQARNPGKLLRMDPNGMLIFFWDRGDVAGAALSTVHSILSLLSAAQEPTWRQRISGVTACRGEAILGTVREDDTGSGDAPGGASSPALRMTFAIAGQAPQMLEQLRAMVAHLDGLREDFQLRDPATNAPALLLDDRTAYAFSDQIRRLSFATRTVGLVWPAIARDVGAVRRRSNWMLMTTDHHGGSVEGGGPVVVPPSSSSSSGGVTGGVSIDLRIKHLMAMNTTVTSSDGGGEGEQQLTLGGLPRATATRTTGSLVFDVVCRGRPSFVVKELRIFGASPGGPMATRQPETTVDNIPMWLRIGSRTDDVLMKAGRGGSLRQRGGVGLGSTRPSRREADGELPRSDVTGGSQGATIVEGCDNGGRGAEGDRPFSPTGGAAAKQDVIDHMAKGDWMSAVLANSLAMAMAALESTT